MHTECIREYEEGYAKLCKIFTPYSQTYFNGRKGKSNMFLLKRPNGMTHLFYTGTDGKIIYLLRRNLNLKLINF